MLGLLLVFLFELTRLVQPRQDTQGRGMHGSNMVVVRDWEQHQRPKKSETDHRYF